jgi:hypothetical protein
MAPIYDKWILVYIPCLFKNSADVLLLSAGCLAEDGKFLSFNGFHIENCWGLMELMGFIGPPFSKSRNLPLSDPCRVPAKW